MVRATVIEDFVIREPDETKHSAAYKIFNYTWDIYVPHTYVYTEEYMRASGMVHTEDEGYNRNLPSQMIGGRYTIIQMAKLFDEGATIKIHNPPDAKKIYDIVRQHLVDWSAYLGRSNPFDGRPVPEAGLMLFSQLADSLYGHAKRFYTNDVPLTQLARRFQQIRGDRGNNGGRRFIRPDDPERLKEEPRQMGGHRGFVDDILTKSQERTPWT